MFVERGVYFDILASSTAQMRGALWSHTKWQAQVMGDCASGWRNGSTSIWAGATTLQGKVVVTAAELQTRSFFNSFFTVTLWDVRCVSLK